MNWKKKKKKKLTINYFEWRLLLLLWWLEGLWDDEEDVECRLLLLLWLWLLDGFEDDLCDELELELELDLEELLWDEEEPRTNNYEVKNCKLRKQKEKENIF